MKNLTYIFILVLSIAYASEAQVIRSFNYQGVVLDDEGRPFSNENVTITISIPPSSVNVTTSATTSSLGAFSVPIEIGQNVEFDQQVNYTIETSITTSEGTLSSSSPLSVVPIAIFAEKAGGIQGVDEIDESPTNEIQTLSIDGNILKISDGNEVNLPTSGGGGDGDNDPNNEVQTLTANKIGNEVIVGLSLTGETVVIDLSDDDNNSTNEIQSLSIVNGNLVLSGNGGNSSTIALSTLGDGTEDDDADPENEIQSLTLSGNTLSISGSNSVDLSGAGGDNDDNPMNEIQELHLVYTNNGEDFGGIGIDNGNEVLFADFVNETQTLQLNGNSLSLSPEGGTVDLSNIGSSNVWESNGGSEIFYNGGNVGIGTNDPNTKLEVDGQAKIDGVTLGFSSGFQSITTQPAFPLNINGHILENGGSNGHVSFTNGVQIGTSTNTAEGTLRYGYFGGGEIVLPSVQISTPSGWVSLMPDGSGTFNSSVQNYIPKTNSSGNLINSELYENNSGNIGIGTTSPTNKLDVIGKIEATENIESKKDIRALDDIFAEDDLFVSGEIRVGVATNSGTYITSNGSNSIVISGDLLPLATNWDVGDNTAGEHWDDMTALDFITFSDQRLKRNIEPLEASLNKVLNLRPVKYQYIESMAADNRNRIGFLAQEIQKIFPTVVIDEDVDIDPKTGEAIITQSNHLSINYTEFIPILTSAIQEQQELIQKQNERINALEKNLVEIRSLIKR